MVKNKEGTREEAEDITSTVLEGADAFILTRETSNGAQPTEAVI